MHSLTIIGAGIWGTALAVRFAERGCKVNLWGRNQTLMEKMASTRYNQAYLPDTRLTDEITCHQDFATAVADGDILLLVTPTATIRRLIQRLSPILNERHQGIAWACKGVEADSGCWIHEVVSETLGSELPLAAVSGPSFAHEVAAGLPTALVIACEQKPFADTLAGLLHGDKLRVYTTDDMVGVECGGALKNILAIAAGIAEGLALGENAKAALITRGIDEAIRFTEAVGVRAETIVGLAGIGDIVLSCANSLSRNQNFGRMIVEYGGACKAREQNTKVVEGIDATRAVLKIANRHKIEMPICEQIALILDDRTHAKAAVEQLLQRQASFQSQ